MFKYNRIISNQLVNQSIQGISLDRNYKTKRNVIKKTNKRKNDNINNFNATTTTTNINNDKNIKPRNDLMKIIDQSEVPVVVHIEPSWDYIKKYNQHLEDIVKNRKGNITLVKLDVDRDYDLVKKFKVLEVPTVLGISRGGINNSIKGKNISNTEMNEFLNKLEDSHYK